MATIRTNGGNGKTRKADRVAYDRTTHVSIGDEDIARRAFELYCERGSQHGHHVEDWLQAERELRASRGASRPF
jgi:hypothetical protein